MWSRRLTVSQEVLQALAALVDDKAAIHRLLSLDFFILALSQLCCNLIRFCRSKILHNGVHTLPLFQNFDIADLRLRWFICNDGPFLQVRIGATSLRWWWVFEVNQLLFHHVVLSEWLSGKKLLVVSDLVGGRGIFRGEKFLRHSLLLEVLAMV